MTETLDVSQFATELPYGVPGKQCDLASVTWPVRAFVDDLSQRGVQFVKRSPSLGFAMADPGLASFDYGVAWNDPRELVWFVGGWGPDRDRYIANAVRKLRAKGATRSIFDSRARIHSSRKWDRRNQMAPSLGVIFPGVVLSSCPSGA